MKLNKLLALAAFVASFWAAAPLSAAVVQVQYTGTVSNGYDMTGIFGAAGSYLDGLAYTANYTFETTNGYTESSANYYQLYGGDAYGSLSPALSATFTINGNTVSISGNYVGYSSGYNYGTFSGVYHFAEERVSTGSGYHYSDSSNSIYNNANTFPASITDPFSYAVTGGDTSYGYFNVGHYNDSSGRTAYAWANLTPDHMTIGAPIPEPETYALLLAGLGLLGFAARRRKLKEASVA